MKKIFLIFFSFFMSIFYFNLNVYASTDYIRVGLSKYKNVNSVSLDNKEIYIGKSENNLFYNDTKLTTNNSFNIKNLNRYSIKINNSFYSYKEALDFSSTYENSYIYKDDYYYVMIGLYNNMIDAENLISSKNINGQVVKLENSVAVYENDKIIIGYKDSLSIKTDEYISLSNKKYRNFIEIVSKNNSLNVINVLDIEEYLYGVVPSEMPSSWHKEALKAQAVACRNYAYSNLGLHKLEGYDVCDTIHCQVYNGFNAEKQSTTEAVNETKGILAYYNNEKINAVYSSSSGGYTDDAKNVWNNDVPYLKAVDDKYEEGAKKWTRTFTFDELSSVLSIGSLKEVYLESSPVTNRVLSLTFVGTSGKKVLEKEEIRTFFSKLGGSLDSRNFSMAKSNAINTTDTKKDTNVDKKSDFYGVSSKGSNLIKDDYVVIDKNNKNNKKTKSDSLFVVNKSQNVVSLNNKKDNNETKTNNTNYVSKITREDNSSVVFIGKGWGHGVGMSQYGANSLAKKGYKYDEILKYYYTGIEVR